MMKVEVSETINTVKIVNPDAGKSTTVELPTSTTVNIRSQGAQGARGADGAQGEQGEQGAQGIQGEKGDGASVSFTYNPNAAENTSSVFNNWADLYAAARPVADEIPVQITFLIPNGVVHEIDDDGIFNFDNFRFAGINVSVGVGGGSVKFKQPFKVSSWKNGKITDFIDIRLEYTDERFYEATDVESVLILVAESGAGITAFGDISPIYCEDSFVIMKGDPAATFANGNVFGGGDGIELIEFAGSAQVIVFAFGASISNDLFGGDISGGGGFLFLNIANGIDQAGWSNSNLVGAANIQVQNNEHSQFVSHAPSADLDPASTDVKKAIDELAARAVGEADEAWTEYNLDGKVKGTLPLAGIPPYIESSLCTMYGKRSGRTFQCIGLMSIPYDADWGDADPFFPIHVPNISADDFPFAPRAYPVIPAAGSNPLNVGTFSLLNTSESDNSQTPNGSFAVGSAFTNFGGVLSTPIFIFFHTRVTSGTLENLLYDGNQVDLVGKNVLIYFGMNYECESALGDEESA